VYSPLGGSAFAGGNRNKLASRLFEAVAADIIADGISSLALTRYAHDEEVGNSFIMNGFGIRCSDAILKLGTRNRISDLQGNITFKELIKEEKQEITGLYRELIRHLSAAPVFYPSDLSRTEHWFSEDGIRVIAAKEKDKTIGYMAFTGSGETFISESENMYNICGAYVEREHQNKGIAQQLLEYICGISEKEGMEYLGVDCETLNPTALRFWGKYFKSYTYSYARRIDERIIGYNDYLKKEWI
jgi:GNAT superfamily N-acetyltransferase